MSKRIGIVCYPTVGGSGVVATELGIFLAEQQYEVHFISTTMPFRLKRLYPNIYFHEVEVANYPVFKHPPYDLSLANKIAEVVDREQLDIIHAHYAVPHAICSLFAKQMAKRDVKIVTTLHGTDITVLGIDDSLQNMIRFAIEQSDAVTAVSESLKTQTQDVFEIDTDIQVVHNFIDLQERIPAYDEDLKRRLGINMDEKVVIHISNFRKVKRVDQVVEAFSKVRDHVQSTLLLVGDGPEYSKVRQKVIDLKLQDDVIFLGRQDNIQDLLKISDVKLLLSEKESFGLVLLEAMSQGVPCVGTKVGGIPEVIDDGVNGFICPLGDLDCVSDKVVNLLTDESLWNKLSSQSKEIVEQQFQTEQIVKQYESVYDRVLE
ncbi:N-acetyl-alpha-D-glucosaminyl L-malate synthase BshA [Alkalibacillus haloalkaliphilus]|uniref:N-acetyl-alpha-D-glucosaminyl L-malate synthase BshA n=1 Tax=Alkalibacillus haloalkaliphilus TaxID=94136 RepID=UPI0029356AC0|nr:N-acetyl-alpha-D-glucosaminyl L-malate synthase BshA [Alkalibacillus haloalkaliphilus]MDV2580811.1 N-acetyl-alpha-D-glucosaminyl L-malate synthase BshA [Alkalibacillus haloalkaliphilus]